MKTELLKILYYRLKNFLISTCYVFYLYMNLKQEKRLFIDTKPINNLLHYLHL
jgi:hypothetical protein